MSDMEPATTVIDIVLALDPMTDQLLVRLSPSATNELLDLMNASGLLIGSVHKYSSMSALDTLWIVLGSSGAWVSLREVLKAYLYANKGKEVRIRTNDQEVTFTGYSVKDVERIVDSLQNPPR